MTIWLFIYRVLICYSIFMSAYFLIPSSGYVVGSCNILEAFCGMTSMQVSVFLFILALIFSGLFLYYSVIKEFENYIYSEKGKGYK